MALLLLTICGLVAGASSTLTADQTSFRLFIFGILVPLPILILVQGHGRFHIAAAMLTVLFAGFILQLHWRSYRAWSPVARTTAAAWTGFTVTPAASISFLMPCLPASPMRSRWWTAPGCA